MSLLTNNLRDQKPTINSECINYYNLTKYKSAGWTSSSKYGSSSILRSVLQRCIPTAACSSHKSELDGGTFLSGDVVENVEEDTLPGVRVERSSLGQRAKAHFSEQELSQWLEKETGTDRVRMMFSVGPDGTFIQEGTRNLNSIFYRSVLLSSVVCVVSAAAVENARIQEKHASRKEALLNKATNTRALLGRIMIESLKGTFRFTAFSASLLYLSQTIAAYRNKSSVWEYAVASTFGFGLLGQGAKHCAKMALRGAVLGTLGGFVVCQILASYGMNQEQKHLECVRDHLQGQNMIEQTPA